MYSRAFPKRSWCKLVSTKGRYVAVALLCLAIGLIGGCSLFESGPVAQFDVQPVVIYAGTSVAFDGSASYAQAAVISYHWLFGDGEEAFGQQVDHPYAEAGTYIVTLEVHDTAGSMASAQKEIVVYAQSGSAIFQDDFSDGEAALDRWNLDPQWASAGEGTIENLGGAHGYVLHIHSGGDRWQRRFVSVNVPPLRVGQRLVFSCEAMMSKTKDAQMLAIYPLRNSLDAPTPSLPYYLFTDIGGGAQIHEVDSYGTDIRHPLSFAPGVYLWYTYKFVFSLDGYEFYVNDILYAFGKSGAMLKNGGTWLIVLGDESHEESCAAYFDNIALSVEE